MNSVMEIGENIIFIDKGQKAWQGSKDEIYDTGCESLEDLVFASELYKKIKTAHKIISSNNSKTI